MNHNNQNTKTTDRLSHWPIQGFDGTFETFLRNSENRYGNEHCCPSWDTMEGGYWKQ
jgi:hypothetical protein